MIETMLVLSTAHVTAEDARLLDAGVEDLIIRPNGEYGWFVHIPRSGDNQTSMRIYARLGGLSNEFCMLATYAGDLGVAWLLLDRDGAKTHLFPVFEW